MRAGWEGGKGGENRGEVAKRLRSGSRAREDKLAAVTERQIKALGLDLGGKKVLEEMKQQSRPSVCPYQIGHYLFCKTNRHKTSPEQHGALDTTRGTEGRSPGCGGEAGAGSAGFVQGGTKDARIPVLGNLRPLESGVLGLGVFYCSLFKSVLGPLAGEAGLGHPLTATPTWGYTSVEKYSVFRFSSAKEMGGCCR